MPSFYNAKYQDSRPVIKANTYPVEHEGYLIFHRTRDVYDIVKDGVCVGMYAGLSGAKQAIRNRNESHHNEQQL